MSKLKEINTQDLIEELCNRGYLRIFWDKDDIKSVALNNFLDPIVLNDQQVNDIASFIEKKWHTEDIGEYWQAIEDAIAIVLDI